MSNSPTDIGNLDRYIEQLMDCKPLSESEVKSLCEKVIKQDRILKYFRLRRFFLKKPTSSLSDLQLPSAVIFMVNSMISSSCSTLVANLP